MGSARSRDPQAKTLHAWNLSRGSAAGGLRCTYPWAPHSLGEPITRWSRRWPALSAGSGCWSRAITPPSLNWPSAKGSHHRRRDPWIVPGIPFGAPRRRGRAGEDRRVQPIDLQRPFQRHPPPAASKPRARVRPRRRWRKVRMSDRIARNERSRYWECLGIRGRRNARTGCRAEVR